MQACASLCISEMQARTGNRGIRALAPLPTLALGEQLITLSAIIVCYMGTNSLLAIKIKVVWLDRSG